MKRPIAAIAILVLGAACAHRHTAMATAAPMEPANQYTIVNIGGTPAVSPSVVTVRAGNAVYFKNAGSTTHRIVLDDRRYDSSDIAPGALGCGLILSDAGTHTFHDLNNPSMTGTIVVTQ